MSKNLELYIHIPFCVKKCNYCDFLSFAADDKAKADYIGALIKEIEKSAPMYKDYTVTSVFIGGGTPSILEPSLISSVVKTVRANFNIKKSKIRWSRRKGYSRPEVEFTIECNPGTVNEEKLKTYKKLGINRLSFGLQSTRANELKELGRIHSFEDLLDSMEIARGLGFNNINIDLMQAIPLQTLESWKMTLAQVIALKPEHISAYSLIIEEGTPFYERMNGNFPLALPDEDEEREIYHETKTILEAAGYKRYEISNYALKGCECRHNKGYWTRENYLGFGLGSSSMVDNVRWKNTSDMGEYILNSADPEKIRTDMEKLSHKEQMSEHMFLGLRLMEGVSTEHFIDTFGVSYDITYGDITRKLAAEELLEVVYREYIDEATQLDMSDTRVKLTDRGIDVSNKVMAEFVL